MSEKTITDLQVGDACFMFGGCRPQANGDEMEVVKVGRQYVHCLRKGAASYSVPIQFTRDRGFEKVSIGTARRIVVDPAVYIAEKEASAAFSRLRNAMGWNLAEGVTTKDVQAAAALLRVDLSKT